MSSEFDEEFKKQSEKDKEQHKKGMCNCDWCAYVIPLYDELMGLTDQFKSSPKHNQIKAIIAMIEFEHGMENIEKLEWKKIATNKFKPGKN